jgi:hypothetical protein
MEAGKINWIKIDTHTDERGQLIAIEKKENYLPFIPVRSFYLMEIPAGQKRAGHAVDCDMLIIALNGNVSLISKDLNKEEKKWIINNKECGILVPSFNYIDLIEFSKDAIIAVFASKNFADTKYFSLDELQSHQ